MKKYTKDPHSLAISGYIEQIEKSLQGIQREISLQQQYLQDMRENQETKLSQAYAEISDLQYECAEAHTESNRWQKWLAELRAEIYGK